MGVRKHAPFFSGGDSARFCYLPIPALKAALDPHRVVDAPIKLDAPGKPAVPKAVSPRDKLAAIEHQIKLHSVVVVLCMGRSERARARCRFHLSRGIQRQPAGKVRERGVVLSEGESRARRPRRDVAAKLPPQELPRSAALDNRRRRSRQALLVSFPQRPLSNSFGVFTQRGRCAGTVTLGPSTSRGVRPAPPLEIANVQLRPHAPGIRIYCSPQQNNTHT